jgi:hypothetical protein
MGEWGGGAAVGGGRGWAGRAESGCGVRVGVAEWSREVGVSFAVGLFFGFLVGPVRRRARVAFACGLWLGGGGDAFRRGCSMCDRSVGAASRAGRDSSEAVVVRTCTYEICRVGLAVWHRRTSTLTPWRTNSFFMLGII